MFHELNLKPFERQIAISKMTHTNTQEMPHVTHTFWFIIDENIGFGSNTPNKNSLWNMKQNARSKSAEYCIDSKQQSKYSARSEMNQFGCVKSFIRRTTESQSVFWMCSLFCWILLTQYNFHGIFLPSTKCRSVVLRLLETLKCSKSILSKEHQKTLDKM